MRGETLFVYDLLAYHDISIHSPHARGDDFEAASVRTIDEFQSTPLMRGETSWNNTKFADIKDFNPLPSCEGRPCRQRY